MRKHPYFVDLVNDELQEHFPDSDFQSNSYRVYTTLDMRLQRAAVEAVRVGMKEVDEQTQAAEEAGPELLPDAQVALIAIDPHTGEVKALIGGRNYGTSQLNHALRSGSRVRFSSLLSMRRRWTRRSLRAREGLHRPLMILDDNRPLSGSTAGLTNRAISRTSFTAR